MIWALHGAVGRSADWRGLSDDLRARYQGELGELRRLDLWRFLDCCPMPLAKFGETLAAEIARVDPEPVLLGYSMGGRLALHALLARPDLWKAAVIVSAHPGLKDESGRAERRQRDAEWSALALKGEWAEFLERWNGQSVLGGSVKMPDRMKLKGRRASVARSFVDWSLGAQQDLSPDFGQIACPLLWVTGARDEKFTRLAEAVVPRISDGRHIIVPDCGHRVPWELSEMFVDHCGRFLVAEGA